MNPHEIATKGDLLELEKRINSAISALSADILSQPKAESSEEFLTRKQVLQLFSISENTFTDMLNDGLPYIPVGSRSRYSRLEVVKFLKDRKKPKFKV